VTHSRGTRAAPRRLIARLAAARGRPAHFVLLDADCRAAEAGQRRRGRTLDRATMDREEAGWRRLMASGATGEAWRSVTVLDRDRARELRGLRFRPLPRSMQGRELSTGAEGATLDPP
jgi:hypothetical protein